MIEMKKLKVPGKVVINGGYLVLNGHYCIVLTVNSYLNVDYKYDDKLQIKSDFDDINTESIYTQKIIQAWEHVTNIKAKGNFIINHDDGYIFERRNELKNSIKTGLGSSASLLVSLVVGLSDIFDIKVNDKLIFDINSIVSPKSSGCDVITCYNGSQIYSKTEKHKIRIPKNLILILGSFGKSTCTREMIKKYNLEDKCLIEINNRIVKNILRNGFEVSVKNEYLEYVKRLHSISSEIVPNAQYEILLKSFNYNIWGCGVSGSGGEDAIWCIAPVDSDIIGFWKTEMKYVKCLEIVNHGLTYENN